MFVRFAILAALATGSLGRVVSLDEKSSVSTAITSRDTAPSLLFARTDPKSKRGCSPKNCGKACEAVAKRDGRGFVKRAEPRATEPDACHWAGKY